MLTLRSDESAHSRYQNMLHVFASFFSSNLNVYANVYYVVVIYLLLKLVMQFQVINK